jgi:hypothetical protein
MLAHVFVMSCEFEARIKDQGSCIPTLWRGGAQPDEPLVTPAVRGRLVIGRARADRRVQVGAMRGPKRYVEWGHGNPSRRRNRRP